MLLGLRFRLASTSPRLWDEPNAQTEPACTPTDEDCEIVAWSTGLQVKHDPGLLASICKNLPRWCLAEQKRLRDAGGTVVKITDGPPAILPSCPELLKDRENIAREYNASLVARGGGASELPEKAPKGTVVAFVKERMGLHEPAAVRRASQKVIKWHLKWREGGSAMENARGGGPHSLVCKSRAKVQSWLRKRASAAGRPYMCSIIRQQLFEWFVSMRHSLDYKVLTRFPRLLLRAKLLELTQAYCTECLLNGTCPKVPRYTAGWFDLWQDDFNVTLRRPNRKFKVPRWVLKERLGIWWLNLFRIRKLCLLVFGYDRGMENFDQSPYHKNESGSQNVGTLSMQGARPPNLQPYYSRLLN